MILGNKLRSFYPLQISKWNILRASELRIPVSIDNKIIIKMFNNEYIL